MSFACQAEQRGNYAVSNQIRYTENMHKNDEFFEEHHTADWSLRVHGENLENLFENAIKGMYGLSSILSGNVVGEIEMEFSGDTHEDLLVDMLNNVLFYLEVEQVVLLIKEMHLNDHQLSAIFQSAEIDSIQKEIKAVTYADMNIEAVENGFETRIVFDV